VAGPGKAIDERLPKPFQETARGCCMIAGCEANNPAGLISRYNHTCRRPAGPSPLVPQYNCQLCSHAQKSNHPCCNLATTSFSGELANDYHRE